jgi:polyhydroxyalkanoate synthesis regulator phasin
MIRKEKERIADLGKKVVDLGLGLVSVSDKKIREVADELIQRGEIKKEEAEQFIDKLLKKTEKDRKGLEERITGVVKKVIEKLPLATKSELNEIKKKLNELEKKR